MKSFLDNCLSKTDRSADKTAIGDFWMQCLGKTLSKGTNALGTEQCVCVGDIDKRHVANGEQYGDLNVPGF